jgi:hydroxymethylpyrimidine pyrophosphatase-like HAD family hydrolase
MTVLIATDLDRTLIYSRAGLELAPGATVALDCVEVHEGKQSSFMTAAAALTLTEIAQRATVIAVTTRTVEQLGRVQLPGPKPTFAVAANGGVIVVAGERDRFWTRQVRKQLAESTPLAEVWRHLGAVCNPEWTIKLRNADQLFCYAVIDRSKIPDGFLAEVTAWADGHGWSTSLQGRKLYWVPKLLTKSGAVAEVADRIGAETVIAAGDSLLDRDLLLAADRAIMPRHGELFASGWSAPGVELTGTSGVLAGQEIASWFAAQLGPL